MELYGDRLPKWLQRTRNDKALLYCAMPNLSSMTTEANSFLLPNFFASVPDIFCFSRIAALSDGSQLFKLVLDLALCFALGPEKALVPSVEPGSLLFLRLKVQGT